MIEDKIEPIADMAFKYILSSSENENRLSSINKIDIAYIGLRKRTIMNDIN
jgi:hypothetical protein